MKRFTFLIVACLLFLGNISAQRVGSWSIMPRVGLNLSNLGDMNVYLADAQNTVIKPNFRADVVAGAEVDYLLHPLVSLSVGAYYSRQGCHYKNYSVSSIMNNDPNQVRNEGTDHNNVTLQYLNIPVMAKLHVTDIISFKTGVQCGVFLSGKWVMDNNVTETANNEVKKSLTNHVDSKLNSRCSKTVWSIPVGIEFEYERTNISVSYAIPLSSFAKDVTGDGGIVRLSKGCNKVFSFTVGYRI